MHSTCYAQDLSSDKNSNISHCSSVCQSKALVAVHEVNCSTNSRLWGYKVPRIKVTMLSLVTIAVLFLVCLPPEAVSQQCRSGVTDEIRQSVREQLRQGGVNGTIPTVAVNCGQVGLHGCMGILHSKLLLSKHLCYSIKIPIYIYAYVVGDCVSCQLVYKFMVLLLTAFPLYSIHSHVWTALLYITLLCT